MLDWRPQTISTGRFTHIYFVESKPDSLSEYFNNAECSKTGIVLFIGI